MNTVPFVMVVSTLSLILLLSGLGWTIQNQFFSEKQVNAIKTETNLEQEMVSEEGKVIVALGDSLTRGTGDAEGKGYIGYLVEQLQQKTNEKISLYNLGVTGYRSNQLLNQVNQQEIIRQIEHADMILITIGGNDLFQSGQTLLNLDLAKVEEFKKSYLLTLDEILKQIRIVNQHATIYLVGLYNPFIDLNDAEVTTKVVRQWNFEASNVLDQHQNSIFVPTFDLFQLKVNDYLYSDKFHPNTEGYKLIAERVASLITW
jgi:lysophospholipase L1-like esterase